MIKRLRKLLPGFYFNFYSLQEHIRYRFVLMNNCFLKREVEYPFVPFLDIIAFLKQFDKNCSVQGCAKFRVKILKRVRMYTHRVSVSQKFNYYTANWLYTYTAQNLKNCDISYKRKMSAHHFWSIRHKFHFILLISR